MDEQVKKSLAKWPNVPDCFGWLGLDARGHWRFFDERAQQEKSNGERLSHAGLVGFINRNYASDNAGRWFMQNGPQRVFVQLTLTPFVFRLLAMPDSLKAQAHTGWQGEIVAAHLDEIGRFYLQVIYQNVPHIGVLHDADMALLIENLTDKNDQKLTDDLLEREFENLAEALKNTPQLPSHLGATALLNKSEESSANIAKLPHVAKNALAREILPSTNLLLKLAGHQSAPVVDVPLMSVPLMGIPSAALADYFGFCQQPEKN
jgi:hypothetical protein